MDWMCLMRDAIAARRSGDEQPPDEIVGQLAVRTINGRRVELSQTVVGATVDYIWTLNGRVYAAGELKRRNIAHDAFSSLMVSASKITELQRMAKFGYLMVLYTDGLYVKRLIEERRLRRRARRGSRTWARSATCATDSVVSTSRARTR